MMDDGDVCVVSSADCVFDVKPLCEVDFTSGDVCPQTFSLRSDLLIINLDLEKVSARLRLVGP